MNTLMMLLFLVCIICSILGIIKPSLVIKWGEPSKVTRKKAILTYGIGTIIFFILFGVTIPDEYNTATKNSVVENSIDDSSKEDKNEQIKETDKVEVVSESANNKIQTTELYENLFKTFSDRIGLNSFESDRKVIESMGYEMKITQPDEDNLGEIEVEDVNGNEITLLYYPDNGIEKLYLLAYGRDNCSITITNEMHTVPKRYTTYDIDAEPRNKNVSSLNDLEKFMFVDMANVTSNISSDKIDASIDVTTKFDKSGKVYFEISSNLPDETQLMLTLSNDKLYSGQTKVSIKSGKATSEAFSNKGDILESGDYKLNITMPMTVVQANSVRKLLGNKGENLTGSLVVDGITGESRTLEKEIKISL